MRRHAPKGHGLFGARERLFKLIHQGLCFAPPAPPLRCAAGAMAVLLDYSRGRRTNSGTGARRVAHATRV